VYEKANQTTDERKKMNELKVSATFHTKVLSFSGIALMIIIEITGESNSKVNKKEKVLVIKHIYRQKEI
jgi:ATP-dependent helicase/DNAse subunit B|tara:strand:+ start:2924 stop:3130 length:207 start_codon:yes stop_codon:yes gene_type:complete